MPFDGLLIGFSTVGDNAPARDGRYLRRLFYLNWLDLDPESIYQTRKHFLPFEGVRPLSVRPGIWGQL